MVERFFMFPDFARILAIDAMQVNSELPRHDSGEATHMFVLSNHWTASSMSASASNIVSIFTGKDAASNFP